ncbi:MAG: phage virion morphogenesis protein [Bacteroidales bacterium]|nr:phage virion morphogenesis protein [Bacteroidales bacterium]
MGSDENIKSLKRRILKDIGVELHSEFDRNFETQSFFGEAWQRQKSPVRAGKHILVDKGNLRRSISSKSDEDSITFQTTLPYAAIHNAGGEIKVTSRMKRFFWAMYYKANGGLGRRKDGTLRRDKHNAKLSTEAEFWKHMALLRIGSTVKIPRRRFIGTHPNLEKEVRAIIEKRLTEFYTNPENYKI